MLENLNEITPEKRLKAYNSIVEGCQHIYSKGKLQENKLTPVLENFIELSKDDPIFLAHFTSYAINKLKSKDLKLISTYANSLSDADGTPFSKDSQYKKPNYRVVSQAAIQSNDFNPKMVLRLIKIAQKKRKIGDKQFASHFPRSLKTAIKKYIQFRENSPNGIKRLRQAGFSEQLKNIYRSLHLSPNDDTASILGWKQKSWGKGNKNIEIQKAYDFSNLSDIEIAEKIREENLSPLGTLGALERKISPVIAVSVLEQATGDQAVILRQTFDEQGLLKNKKVMKLFEEKIKTAKTALDRVEKIKTEIDKDTEKILKKTKSNSRKKEMGDIGKIFMHIDVSYSMNEALELAKNYGATIAECVNNPQENFAFGCFDTQGRIIPNPETFEKDAFRAALYNEHANNRTNCLALYSASRKFNADIEIFITDGGHNEGGSISNIINKYSTKPKLILIVKTGLYDTRFANELRQNNILVEEIRPEVLKESALVVQAIKTGLKGKIAVIDEIMNEPLLTLPKWWFSI